jgi:ABC-2 type transport system permease protein
VTALVGTGRLLRLALRRDRILLPAWAVSIAALAAGVVASIVGLYTSEQERVAAVTFSAANPVARVFDGPASGTDPGAIAMGEGYVLYAVLAALMSIQAVVRHTRTEEETGRAELVGSAVVGRHAPLAAALITAALANLAVGALVAVVLLANDLAVAGSLLSGLSLAGVGLVFAGVAAVVSQVLSTSRGANGAGAAVVGLAFVLRAVGDVAGDIAEGGLVVVSAWPSWLSPIGWAQQTRPFHQDNFGLLALFAATAVALIAVAVRLTEHRDVGAGMVAPRPGPARAAAGLGSPLGLAWRQQRGVLLGWAVAIAIVGAAFGSVGAEADEIVGLSEDLERALQAMAPEGGMVELYFAFAVGFLGIAATGFTVQALLRARAEEAAGRLEAVLATATSRTGWLAGHVIVAVAGTVALFVLLGLTGALAYGAVTGDWAVGVEGMLGGAAVQIPAALALGALVLVAVALLPRWAAAVGWAALAVGLVMGQLGALLELPQPVLNLSPFTHVPAVPAESLSVLPLAVLLAAAAGLGALGFAGFARRDLLTTP